MANKKITELTELTSPAGADLFAIVDDTDTTTKKVTVTNLMGQAPVQSVNTATGAVVLDADDIDDTSTTNKFVTAADITNLGNLSGTNTGDQDISGLATQVSLGNHEALTSAVHGISAFGATLVDDADASAARTTLGLGTAATSASTDFASTAKALTTPTFTGTPPAYTLTSAENGKVVIVDESNNAYITVPQSLGSGFNCTIVQKGTGRVILQAGTGASVAGYNLGVATIGQYGVIDLVPISTDNYYVTGDTSTAPFVNTYSADFDGVDDQLYFGTSPSNRNVNLGSSDFALSMWLYPQSTTQDFLWADSAGGQRVFITGGNLSFRGIGTNVDISSAYSINNWYHLVWTRTSGTEKIYINNVEKNSRSESGSVNISTIGAWLSTSGYFFDGQMDEISFHSQGLSSSDVSAIYNSGLPDDLSGSYNTTHWWRMGDSASGSTILDQVGSEDLTASGASLTGTNIPS